MANLINTTPHSVNIVDTEGKIIKTIPASGSLIRLKTNTVSAGFAIEGVPVTTTVFGEPEGLPELEWELAPCTGGIDEHEHRVYCGCPQEGQTGIPKVYYIVSQIVKSAFPNRLDLLVPAEMVRDSNGNIVGCKSLGI